jgi:cell division protein FtsW (lipid II flippase)
MFFAGMSWRIMGAIGAAGAVAVPILWPFLHDYQRRRILTLLDPRATRSARATTSSSRRSLWARAGSPARAG